MIDLHLWCLSIFSFAGSIMTYPPNAPHGFTTLLCCRCGNSIQVPIHCSSKSCSVCTAIRRWRIQRRIYFALEHAKQSDSLRWRHVILTLKSTYDLESQLDRLVKSFRRLRHRKLWKATQFMGFYVIEISKGKSGWHAHLHIVSYGLFLPFRKLRSAWYAITKDSFQVWLRWIKPQTDISRYVSKYITKVSDLTLPELTHLDTVTKHRRLFGPFGTAHKLMIKWKPPANPTVCAYCGCTDFIPDFVLSMLSRQASFDP